jgi:hypothetical protein
VRETDEGGSLERILGIATKSMKLVKSVPRLNATIIM